LEKVEKLCEATPTPMFQASPDSNALKDLPRETEDTDFWKNFKKGAPIIFCMAIEDD